MGNQYGGAEFSEALWEERTQKTGAVKSEIWRKTIVVVEMEM